MKTLGIDLGTNSLGWAVINETGIETTGVLVFEEGIIREKGIDSLKTPAALRREARMARRLRFRRHLRRRLILKILIEQKMCPLTQAELKAWSQTGLFPKDNAAFVEWLKSTDTRNPYCDRARAAAEKVDPFTLGRAIYHLAQRRGFKSGRKDQPAEGEEKSAAAKEREGLKSEIAALTAKLEKSGLTLGQYFYEEIKRGHKVRKRHTGRAEHYQKEWTQIAKVQNLSKDLTDKIDKTLFWQRPLREQSFLVGKCPLEPKRNRAQIGHPEFEEFRTLSFVNNIQLSDRSDMSDKKPLTPQQRAVAADCFIRKTPFDFKTIRQKLEKTFIDLKDAAFNYEDNVALSPSKVTAVLREFLPDATPGNIQKAFDALTFFDDPDKLEAWAQKRLGLSAEDAKKFVKIHIPEGRASYSLHAIRKILPFLREGCEQSEAVFYAKLPEALRDFNEKKDAFIAELRQLAEDYRKDKKHADPNWCGPDGKPVPSLVERREEWFEKQAKSDGVRKWPDNPFEFLYFRDPKADSSYASVKPGGTVLPPVHLGMIRNPLVQRSMTMLRKLVNELRRKGTIDAGTRIHIELARDVNSRNDRMAIQEMQKQNEATRKAAREALLQYTANPSEEEILKYVLAEEQGWVCLYTGRHISISGGGSLFPGFDIEHTIPRSRSGDDSQDNKTLCEIQFNRHTKKGLTPSELANFGEIETRLRPWAEKIDDLKKLKEKQAAAARCAPKDNPKKRGDARQKLIVTKLELRYWKDKYQRFSGVHLDGPKKGKPIDFGPSFISRQLVDTGIMTRHAVALLKTVYHDVYPVNGQAVAFARKLWKVQGEDEFKDRSDHTHHAKDAMVIAALSRDRFQKICAELKADDERKNPSFTVASPFSGFAQAVYNATTAIAVKHMTRHNEFKQTRYTSKRLSGLTKGKDRKPITRAPAKGDTVRGQLHKDTFYGKIRLPGKTEIVCVIRKELSSANFKSADALETIVDPAVKARIKAIIATRGDDFKKAIDQGGFTMASGIPIKKVRIQDRIRNPLSLRDHEATPSQQGYKNLYYVAPAENSNFSLSVYRIGNANPLFVVENLLKFVQGEIHPVPEGANRVGRILPGAMAIAYQRFGEWDEPDFPVEKRLYKVENFSDSDGRMVLRFHKEARKMTEVDEAKQSSVDFEQPHPLLRLSFKKAWSTFCFEGIHFRMGFNGAITFIDRESEE